MRVSGVPFDQGKHPQGALIPTAVVMHRTYGTLNGDGFKSAYSIGKNGRSGLGIGFHFLVGKNEGQWVQFYDTTVKSAHAKGANSWAIGIEFDGVNEGPLTDWQVRAGAAICRAISEAHGIPLTYWDGPRQRVTGYLGHASVPTSTHTDRLTREDWDRIVALAQVAVPVQPEPQPDGSGVDLAAIAAGIAEASKQVIKQGSKGDAVKWAQALLNNKLENTNLSVDGNFGPASAAATRIFQRNVKRFFRLNDSQMKVDGIIGPTTWFWLTR
ncbi:N-acetylmuramoyl-L-alanine amidase domain [uncultured Caudovirales phage]|uniref:N-acetylmuramoyl-L-alanine amidase domain n=1 Tax=uncultured Caudovirales phage TaxID=2100421 RepID=A0A6J5RGB1_9CAUD|nr:N-acetylmuramoyl-L-alanine amidase domain [uncultured Caudovirales phage]